MRPTLTSGDRGRRSSCRGTTVLLGHDERDGEEVAVARALGRGRAPRPATGGSIASSSAPIGIDEITSVHGVGRWRRRRSSAVTATARPPAWLDLGHAVLHHAPWCPRPRPCSRAALPHHPGAVLRVLELLDQGGDLLLVALRAGWRSIDGLAERQVLDALRGPVGRDLVGRHAPDLLGVGLEEDAVEAPAEARRRPALERGLVLRRPDAHPEVRAARSAPPRRRPRFLSAFMARAGSRRTCPGSRCGSCAGRSEEVLVGQDLVPQRPRPRAPW